MFVQEYARLLYPHCWILRELMYALDINKAIVGGHSMGANVALNFAFKYPERCIGLILVGIGSGSSDSEWWCGYWNKLADLADEQGMQAFLEEMKTLPAWAAAFQNPPLAKRITEDVLANSPKVLAKVIRGVQVRRASIFSLKPQLEKLPVDTLVVMSEGDAPVVECSRFMVEHIPQATLAVIPAKSHWIFDEAPEPFMQAVDQYVSRLRKE